MSRLPQFFLPFPARIYVLPTLTLCPHLQLSTNKPSIVVPKVASRICGNNFEISAFAHFESAARRYSVKRYRKYIRCQENYFSAFQYMILAQDVIFMGDLIQPSLSASQRCLMKDHNLVVFTKLVHNDLSKRVESFHKSNCSCLVDCWGQCTTIFFSI